MDKEKEQEQSKDEKNVQANQPEAESFDLPSELRYHKEQLQKLNRQNSELIWAQTFNSTIRGSRWLKKQNFALGRWAIGYPCAYALYRILDEARPKRILELGLGQSTKFTAQYAAAYKNVQHTVVDHDPEWVSFFKKGFKLPETTKVVLCPWAFEEHSGAEGVRIFEGFHKAVCGHGNKYDLIVIDAPFGGDMKEFSRIDVLKEMPDCLAKNFIILIDDYDRPGEKHTVAEMLAVLKEHGIAYKTGVYRGEKDVCVICSEKNKFFASM